MNSPTQPPVEAVEIDGQVNPESVENAAKTEIPAFKFPFKPGELAGEKNASQPWYKNGAKNGHTKSPGMAPPGTRRSMGKR
ncbi:hypothetical protein HKK55_20125 [Pseudomonas sp. ADAK18]|uniref:hypothetical protein n=1 Tax=Pseudomonas sp. ADAK18 TaxID=2730848 RepID=UPI001463C069|nr:hypothetical protein [Pseudomonas sp. ADAK18]QJI30913.1 hypothetical protein HKK55_20125 [Pseudomonas sp. ADAK18]